MSDMKRLIEKMDQFAGQAVGQKPGDQVRGTEKATKRKDNKHPFAGRLVGASESKSILQDLEKELVENAVKRSLAEEFADFKEATMTPQQVAAAKTAAPYGYNPQTGKPNPAPAGQAAPAQPAAPVAPKPAAPAPAQPAAVDPEQAMLDRLAAKEGLPPGSTLDQINQAKEQKLLDRMGKRFGLPPGATMDQVQAAQQAHLDKNDPAAAEQYRQQMSDIDAGKTPSNDPIQLKQQEVTPQTMQQYDPNFAAGMAAHKAGGSPIDMMLAQPAVAGNQQMLDAIASGIGLPAGSTVEQIKATVAAQKAPAAPVDPEAAKAAAQQKAIDDIAVKHGIPTGLTQDEFMKEWQKKVQSQLTLPAGYEWGPDGKPVQSQQQAAPVAEGDVLNFPKTTKVGQQRTVTATKGNVTPIPKKTSNPNVTLRKDAKGNTVAVGKTMYDVYEDDDQGVAEGTGQNVTVYGNNQGYYAWTPNSGVLALTSAGKPQMYWDDLKGDSPQVQQYVKYMKPVTFNTLPSQVQRIIGRKLFNQGVAEAEGEVDIEPALRGLESEFDKFLKHGDRMDADPAYAKKWNQQYAKYAGPNNHGSYGDHPDDDLAGLDEGSNPEDTVTMDVPLMIRIMEYAREDAKTDMDLHDVAENLIRLSAQGNTLSMSDYDTIMGDKTRGMDEGMTPPDMHLDKINRVQAGDKVFYKGKLIGFATGETDGTEIVYTPVDNKAKISVDLVSLREEEFVGEAEEQNDNGEEFGYRKLHPHIFKARQKYPLAKSDMEALLMMTQDKEEQDINRVDKVNDREDAEISQLDREEDTLQRKMTALMAQMTQLKSVLDARQVKEDIPPAVATAGGPAGVTQAKQTPPGTPVDPAKAALEKQQQSKLQQNLAGLKSAGVQLDPAKAAQSLQKTDTGAPMNAMDKDVISKMAPAIGNIMANPTTATQLNTLIKKAGGGA